VDVVMGRALVVVGPSVVAAAVTEAFAFGAGYFTAMPAVASFAAYAAMAVAVNGGLQLTAFVAVLSLDLRRAAAGRDAAVVVVPSDPAQAAAPPPAAPPSAPPPKPSGKAAKTVPPPPE
jgi:uncharacterized membrane protein YdfJ with MMPL/SSD domain